MQRRKFGLATAGLGLTGLAATWATAARAATGFPERPVRVISPYAAGGGPDVQLRQMSNAFGEALGQPIVVENKVGAGGVLAAQYVASAPPDGYTLIMGANTHLVQKVLQPELRFDPIGDFTPISNLFSSPTVLVVNASSPYRSVADLVAAMKARPDAMNYGSGGIGTSAHLAGATLLSVYGVKATHIPLKGSVEISASLLRGDTQFACPIAGTGVPQVLGGKLRALATTGRARLKQLPDVPTLYELTQSELTIQESWLGLWAPAKTPPGIITRLHEATSAALLNPEVRAALEAAGNVVAPNEAPAAVAAFIRSENRKWAEIVRLTGTTI